VESAARHIHPGLSLFIRELTLGGSNFGFSPSREKRKTSLAKSHAGQERDETTLILRHAKDVAFIIEHHRNNFSSTAEHENIFLKRSEPLFANEIEERDSNKAERR
jgi:hypothetical protein